MREIGDLRGLDAEPAAQLPDALHHLAARRIRSRQHLEGAQRTRRLVESAKIRECPADVDADPIPHAPASAPMGAGRTIQGRNDEATGFRDAAAQPATQTACTML